MEMTTTDWMTIKDWMDECTKCPVCGSAIAEASGKVIGRGAEPCHLENRYVCGLHLTLSSWNGGLTVECGCRVHSGARIRSQFLLRAEGRHA